MRMANRDDVRKRVLFRVLAKFRDDKGIDASKTGDLPINVPHFLFQEMGAVTCDQEAALHG